MPGPWTRADPLREDGAEPLLLALAPVRPSGGGVPVFATDCCDQINRLDEPRVTVSGRERLADAIGSHFAASLHDPVSPVAPTPNPGPGLLWSDRAKRLRQSMNRHFSTAKAIDLTVIPGTGS
jgi:hypothetical protein